MSIGWALLSLLGRAWVALIVGSWRKVMWCRPFWARHAARGTNKKWCRYDATVAGLPFELLNLYRQHNARLHRPCGFPFTPVHSSFPLFMRGRFLLSAWMLGASIFTAQAQSAGDPVTAANLYVAVLINNDSQYWWPLLQYRKSLESTQSLVLRPHRFDGDDGDDPKARARGRFLLAEQSAKFRSECRSENGYTVREQAPQQERIVVSVPITCRVLDFSPQTTGLIPRTVDGVRHFFPLGYEPTTQDYVVAARAVNKLREHRLIKGEIWLSSTDGGRWDVPLDKVIEGFDRAYYREIEGDFFRVP